MFMVSKQKHCKLPTIALGGITHMVMQSTLVPVPPGCCAAQKGFAVPAHSCSNLSPTCSKQNSSGCVPRSGCGCLLKCCQTPSCVRVRLPKVQCDDCRSSWPVRTGTSLACISAHSLLVCMHSADRRYDTHVRLSNACLRRALLADRRIASCHPVSCSVQPVLDWHGRWCTVACVK